ncbi:MAG: hypothetical protein DMF89_26485 [Acidobacteria bacterium]|nr:MAG: hypothetical protein DMF89_26485 [Acidobacteriota bacterium]
MRCAPQLLGDDPQIGLLGDDPVRLGSRGLLVLSPAIALPRLVVDDVTAIVIPEEHLANARRRPALRSSLLGTR